MGFKITIEQTTEKPVKRQGEWKVVRERLITTDEFEKAGYGFHSEGNERSINDAIKAGQLLIKEYGNTPDYDAVEKDRTKIYEQEVSDLDLASVIRAVNRI